MELNAAHRRAFETKRIDAQIKPVDRDHEQRRLGQIFAFVVCMTAIVGGCIVAVNGHQLAGAVIGTGGLASVVTAFVWNRKHPEAPADKVAESKKR